MQPSSLQKTPPVLFGQHDNSEYNNNNYNNDNNSDNKNDSNNDKQMKNKRKKQILTAYNLTATHCMQPDSLQKPSQCCYHNTTIPQ